MCWGRHVINRDWIDATCTLGTHQPPPQVQSLRSKRLCLQELWAQRFNLEVQRQQIVVEQQKTLDYNVSVIRPCERISPLFVGVGGCLNGQVDGAFVGLCGVAAVVLWAGGHMGGAALSNLCFFEGEPFSTQPFQWIAVLIGESEGSGCKGLAGGGGNRESGENYQLGHLRKSRSMVNHSVEQWLLGWWLALCSCMVLDSV